MTMMAVSIDPRALARRTREMIDGKRAGVARPLFGALQKLAPDTPGLHVLSARLLSLEGRLPEALAEMDRALMAAPADEEALLGRAELRLLLEDLTGAVQDAAEAVILERRSARAKAMLGAILIELGRADEAAVCLAEAVRAEPRRAPFRLALAEAEERAGDAARAARTLDVGTTLLPGHVGLRVAAIMTAMRQRDFEGAIRIAEAARAAGAADACVFGLLGHARSSLGQHDAAADAYCEAWKLAPDDPYVHHLVAASGILPQGDRAPAAYVEAVFDGYADRFERDLVGLDYRVPGLMRAALQAQLDRSPRHIGSLLDLGCGTGLIGVVLSDLSLGSVTGIDLSRGMLAHAQRKNLYAHLHSSDIADFLERSSQHWELMLAADVFCYFGSLNALLRLAFDRLALCGLLIFSIEELMDSDYTQKWRLGRLGRYLHAHAYVDEAVQEAGFTVRRDSREVLRFEAGSGVNGRIIVLEKCCDSI